MTTFDQWRCRIDSRYVIHCNQCFSVMLSHWFDTVFVIMSIDSGLWSVNLSDCRYLNCPVIGVGVAAPLQTNSHRCQPGYSATTDDRPRRLLRHLHGAGRSWAGPRTHTVLQVHRQAIIQYGTDFSVNEIPWNLTLFSF